MCLRDTTAERDASFGGHVAEIAGQTWMAGTSPGHDGEGGTRLSPE